MTSSVAYRGRFAPSPTGPLHFGSLITALGSYLEARRHGGEWQLRIDDIDPAREQPGAADAIRRTLERLGLEHDGPVVFQSERSEAHASAIAQLANQGSAFACGCTRKMVLRGGTRGPNGVLYPGTCRNGLPEGRSARTWRAHARGVITIDDALQGHHRCDLAESVGDFLIQRADGWPAYHLAAAVDDTAAGITHVVRGFDLMLCTPPQVHLMHALAAQPPRYAHLPLACDRDGRKLSKVNGATAIDDTQPAQALVAGLNFLQQAPPDELRQAPPAEILAWARHHWEPARLVGVEQAVAAPDALATGRD
ncbi:MAG: tRNA glutamyl-Q(34) synthetase GluQRS [Ectothiorhodospiraceae bacterium]